jgi:protein-tyrosine phosphatase
MLDFHSHLLYGIDDGVKDRAQSLEILAEYKAAGIDHVVFTPHLYNPYVTTAVKDIRAHFADLHQAALELGVETYLGAELFVRHQELKTIPVLGRYALCEFDVYSEPLGFCDLIDRTLMQGMGNEIVIAHVERYTWLEPGGQRAQEMKSRGYLFQVNAESVADDVSSRARKWLHSGMVDLIASDNHGRTSGSAEMLVRAYEKFPRIAAKMKEIEDGIR